MVAILSLGFNHAEIYLASCGIFIFFIQMLLATSTLEVDARVVLLNELSTSAGGWILYTDILGFTRILLSVVDNGSC